VFINWFTLLVGPWGGAEERYMQMEKLAFVSTITS
jgi:hypothetical protein